MISARDIFNASILIVDDQEVNVQLLEQLLSEAGYNRVTSTMNPQAVCELHHKNHYDLILLDVQMPGMDGFQVMTSLQKANVDNYLPVIVLTAQPDHKLRALQVGAKDFISKPFDVIEVKMRIHNMLEVRLLYKKLESYNQSLEKTVEVRTVELGESELQFRQLAENIQEVFFLIGPQFEPVFYISPAYEEIWGRSCASLYADPMSWGMAIHPSDQERALKEVAPNGTMGQFDTQYRIVRPDGTIRWIRDRGFPISNDKGEVYRIAGIAEDITESKEQQQKITRLSRIYAVLSGINSAIVRIHNRSELLNEACRIAVSEGVFRMAWIGEIDPDTLDGKVVAWQGGEAGYIEQIRLTAQPGTPNSERPACICAREKRVVICNDVSTDPSLALLRETLLARGHHSLAVFPLILGDRAAGVLALFAGETGFFDEAELKLLNELVNDIAFSLQYIEKEEKLNYLACYDVLTGLPNGALFNDGLNQFLSRFKYDKGIIAVILIDLDRFTQINDTFGRHIGDELLRIVANRIKDALREPYSVARINADLYAVALIDLAHGTDAAAIFHDRIMGSLLQPVVLEGQEIRLSAKAGIALYPDDGDDAEELFKHAEVALKHAQSSGEEYFYYAPEINARAVKQLAFESRLRKAVEQEHFVLHYQPKFNSHNGRMVGLEALIRWNDPITGLIPPVEFISILEQTGLILNVGRWVLEKALADYRAWLEQGLRPPRIAVNVSPIQLQRQNFAHTVREVIERTQISADALEIEITEGVLLQDMETNIQTLHEIRKLGVKVALDDFGTGYSSLCYLAKLPIDTLKIDRSFIITMMSDAVNMAIVSTVISLAHSLNLNVIAEGVDSEEQAKALRLMRCDEMQGFLFSKPVSADAIPVMLKDRGVY